MGLCFALKQQQQPYSLNKFIAVSTSTLFAEAWQKKNNINYLTKVVLYQELDLCHVSSAESVHSCLRARKLCTVYNVDCIYCSSQIILFFIYNQVYHIMGLNCVAQKRMTECDKLVIQWLKHYISIVTLKDQGCILSYFYYCESRE